MQQEIKQIVYGKGRPSSQQFITSAAGLREAFGVAPAVRRETVATPTAFDDLRKTLIAHVDPLPSANDNLLIVRGICNWSIKKVKDSLLPFVAKKARFVAQRLSRFTRRQSGAVPLPISILALALIEGTLLWVLGAVAVAAHKMSNRPLEIYAGFVSGQ